MFTTSRTYFTIDFLNKSIVGTKTSFDRASKGSGRIYEELTDKMAAHPEFKMVIKAQKAVSTKSKRTYEGLDFAFMEEFIAMQENAELLMKKYEAVKRQAKNRNEPTYPLTKKWFLKAFSTKENPFDMEKAKKKISDYRIKMAISPIESNSAVVLDGIPEVLPAVS